MSENPGVYIAMKSAVKRHPLYLFKLYCVQFPSVGVRRDSEMKKKGIAGSLPRKQSPWIFLDKSTSQIPNKLSKYSSEVS